MTEYNPLEFGRLVEKVEQIASDMSEVKTDVHATKAEVAALKGTMNKGWGIVIGAVGVIGLFATELVNWVKNGLGIGNG